MALQRTFALLKPGVLQRRLVGEVLGRIEKKGLHIIGLKVLHITNEQAFTHYAEHADKSFYNSLISYITSGPVVAIAVEGDESIQRLRTLCGPTSVSEAAPGTIRGDFCLHTNINIIHSSDSPESASRELAHFFTKDELISWDDGNALWY